jgi:hypothetical protein
MARVRDSESVAALQSRAMLYAAHDKRKAAAMLLTGARGLIGEDKWREALWGAMKERIAPAKPDEER